MPSLPRQEGVRSPVRVLLGETCSAAMRPVRCAFALDRSSLAHPRPDRSGHRMHPLTPLDSAQLPHPLAVPAVHRTWTSSLSCHQPTVTTAVLGTAVSRLSACLALAPSVRLTPIRFAARLYPHSTPVEREVGKVQCPICPSQSSPIDHNSLALGQFSMTFLTQKDATDG